MMIVSILIIAFSLISVAGVIALIQTDAENMNRFSKISLSFFSGSHLFFLALGISKFFISLSVIWLILASIFIITSRILNGLALYGKNNWAHYSVTIAILLAIIALHIGNY